MWRYAHVDKVADFWEDEEGDEVLYVSRRFFKCYPLQDWIDTFDITKIVVMHDGWDIRFRDDDDEEAALFKSKAEELIGF